MSPISLRDYSLSEMSVMSHISITANSSLLWVSRFSRICRTNLLLYCSWWSRRLWKSASLIMLLFRLKGLSIASNFKGLSKIRYVLYPSVFFDSYVFCFCIFPAFQWGLYRLNYQLYKLVNYLHYLIRFQHLYHYLLILFESLSFFIVIFYLI